MPGAKAVIPGPKDGIPDSKDVIPDSIRDPVPRADWIADQVRNDNSEVCNDKSVVSLDSKDVIPDSIRDPVQEFVIPDSIRDPVPRADWIADQVRNDKSVVSPEKLEKLGSDSNRNW